MYDQIEITEIDDDENHMDKVEPDTTPYTSSNKYVTSKNLTIAHWNVDGLLSGTKIEQLMTNIKDISADIVAISESKINENIPDNLIKLQGYNHVRKDRTRWGGGLIIYIKDCISYKHMPDLESDILEHCSIDIFVKNKKLNINCVYRPPHSNENEFITDLNKTLTKIDGHSAYNKIFIGDFNFGNCYAFRPLPPKP